MHKNKISFLQIFNQSKLIVLKLLQNHNYIYKNLFALALLTKSCRLTIFKYNIQFKRIIGNIYEKRYNLLKTVGFSLGIQKKCFYFKINR